MPGWQTAFALPSMRAAILAHLRALSPEAQSYLAGLASNEQLALLAELVHPPAPSAIVVAPAARRHSTTPTLSAYPTGTIATRLESCGATEALVELGDAMRQALPPLPKKLAKVADFAAAWRLVAFFFIVLRVNEEKLTSVIEAGVHNNDIDMYAGDCAGPRRCSRRRVARQLPPLHETVRALPASQMESACRSLRMRASTPLPPAWRVSRARASTSLARGAERRAAGSGAPRV